MTHSACIRCPGSLDRHGYGRVFRGGKTFGAHRVAWEKANGRPVPTGLNVLHSCDNRSCINPAHLWIGTHAENMRDRTLKGRSAHGEGHPQRKLTAAQALLIQSGMVTVHEALQRFPIGHTQFYRVRLGQNWRDISGQQVSGRSATRCEPENPQRPAPAFARGRAL